MKHGHRWLMAALMGFALGAALALVALGSSLGRDALAQGTTIYVDADATGNNNGGSWEDAYTTLQPALEDAAAGDEIWVAAGIYTPTQEFSPGDPRSATFQLKNWVALYGGFDPTVGDVGWEDRDWVGNMTILSGDLGTQGDPADNSYHVFYHPPELALDGSAVLDGFTVSDGNADGDFTRDQFGAGMYNKSSSPALTNCTFFGNDASEQGGGMYNYNSSPTLTSCTFSGNWAASFGGGMCNDSSSPRLTNCSLSGNSVQSGGGGGMYDYESSPALTNCTFSGNSARYGGGMSNWSSSSPAVTNCTFSGNSANNVGGGMENHDSSAAVTNCTFSGNGARLGGGMYNELSSAAVTNCTFFGNEASEQGGGMYNTWSSPALTNCILWGDSPVEIANNGSEPAVTYSDIQGGYEGTGNIDADPLFADPGSSDYHLGPDSPCIDAGTNDAPNLPDLDFEGDPRIMDGDGDGTAVVDMGIDEAWGTPPHALFLPLVGRALGTPTNNPPYAPSDPSPADGATEQDVDVDLAWSGGDPDGDAVTYDVYLEANDDTPDVLVSHAQSSTSYDPGLLAASTHYYWRIVAEDEHGATNAGAVWDFTTGTGNPPGRIAFASNRDGNYEIYRMNADGSDVARLTNNAASDQTPSWSPDGTWIAFCSDRAGSYDIYVMHADGSGVTRLTNTGGNYGPDWSPDGTKIAFYSDRGTADIWVMNADGSNLVQLTTDPGMDFFAAWSPDGSKVAFTSDRTGDDEIWYMNADGTGQTQVTDDPDGWDDYPNWTLDGQRIIFSADPEFVSAIYIINLDGTGMTALTSEYGDANNEIPALSPDGTRIAFISDRDGNREIYVMNSDGTDQTRLTNNPAVDLYPTWSP